MNHGNEEAFNKAKVAITDGDYKRLTEVLKNNPELPKMRQVSDVNDQEFSLTLLHYAVGFPPDKAPPNAIQSIKVLLESGSDIEALDKIPKGSTPLQNAAGYNHFEITKVLLENGADPNSNEFHEFEMDATSLALFESHTRIVKLLVEHGAKVNLDIAAGVGDLARMKTYFDKEGKYINSDTGGDIKIDLLSPFLTACQNGQVESIKYMLELGADINLFPPGEDWGGIGASGLHWAVEKGHLELVKFMVGQGADLAATDDVWNRTPLQWAEAGDNKEMLSYLRSVS